MIGYDDAPRVHVYHRCHDFATGSVFAGGGADPAYWWAKANGAAWYVWVLDVLEIERPTLERRIRAAARLVDAATVDAANAARDAQDAAAEAPDLGV